MNKRIIFLACAVVATVAAWACTSAIVTAKMTANGRPLLWKHRDTSDLNNVVERITPDAGFAYIGLFNAARGVDGLQHRGLCHNEYGVVQSESRHG